ncbi:D-amino-acid dehydrogenase [Devosia pacifica]|uniref:D-amino-acid dehydrogenase n=1 Tax=Devosia pacifica TaxID=1335967 RepID=A0A918VWU0_9HYPH|nr:D-amino acid dehydrogenase [Devosia pacifica]GHA32197.1 D-amino-acid dehydrogenase [Devosia pacifica]
MRIVIIGAGIIGLSTAWQLVRDGHHVTIIDKAGSAGQGTSFANGAQLSYSYVAPLADPSVWAQLPKFLSDSQSPVQFRPGLSAFQYRWLLQFLAACTKRQAEETIERLGELASRSRSVLHSSGLLDSTQFAWRASGKLVVYSSEKSLAAASRQAEQQMAQGVSKQALSRDAVLALEPALGGISQRLVGGIFAPNDETGDALLLCRELERLMAESPNPPVFAYETSVRRIVTKSKVVECVDTDKGRFEADLYVLAAGAYSRILGRTAGLDLPIYPIKGYSLSAPISDRSAAPDISVTDAARKIVLARLGGTLRLAGAADVVGEGLDIDTRRTDKLIADARADFPDAARWQDATLWAGLRPATPTGQPIIGQTRLENLLVNVGHGSLGFTLALGSAERLARVVGGPSR